MLLHNPATGASREFSDREAAVWMRHGWTAVSPEPPVAEDEDGDDKTTAETQSRGKSSARNKKED